jgi:putative transposase
MKRVFRIQGEGKVKDIGLRGLAEYRDVDGLDAKVALIQALIPLGLQAVGDLLAGEVTQLAGPRYARTGGQPGLVRWSHQGGSVYLADQKLALPVPRVRDLARNTEVPLQTYQQLREPRHGDLGLFRKVLLGLSCRDYAACAEAVPAAFGLSPSTVSRRFLRASARKLRAFLERRLDHYDIVALLLDGGRPSPRTRW